MGSRNMGFQMLTAGLDAVDEPLAGLAVAHLLGESGHDILPYLVIDPGGDAPVHQDFHIALSL